MILQNGVSVIVKASEENRTVQICGEQAKLHGPTIT